MSSEKEVHPGRRRSKSAPFPTNGLKEFWAELVSEFEANKETCFLCSYLSKKRRKQDDIVNFTKAFIYDVEVGRRKAEKLPIELWFEYFHHGNHAQASVENTVPTSFNQTDIDLLLEKQSNFLVPISFDPCSGRVLLLRSKTNSAGQKQPLYIHLDIPESYPFLFYSDKKSLRASGFVCGITCTSEFDELQYTTPISSDDFDFLGEGVPFNLTTSMETIPAQYRMFFRVQEPEQSVSTTKSKVSIDVLCADANQRKAKHST